MTLTKNHLVIIALVISVLAFLAPYVFKENKAFGSAATRGTPDCLVSTSTVALVGASNSRTILPENPIRAWAKIQQPLNATNTLALSFDEGAAASAAAGGIALANATTSSYQTDIEFGLDTDFPYTGAVTGSTSAASTTVLITECTYR